MIQLKEFVLNCYANLQSGRFKSFDRVSCLYTIIELKQEHKEIANVGRSLYVDIKEYLFDYCSIGRWSDFGYDRLSVYKIKDVIESSSLSEEKQYMLYSLVLSLANEIQLDIQEIKKRKKRLYLSIAKKDCFVKYLLLLSSNSILSIIITFLLLLLIEIIVLLPSPFPWMSIFDFSTTRLCDNDFANHIVNVIALHLEPIDISSLSPKSSAALLLIAVWYLVIVVLVVNILFGKLLNRIHIDESD